MVELVKEIETGIVCPACSRRLDYYKLIAQPTNRYDPLMREYFGWCMECSRGCEVVQFFKDEKWYIHKYRHWFAIDQNKPVADPDWTVLNELPQIAPVILGPGGDFDEPLELNLGTKDVLVSLQKTLRSVCKLLGEILKAVK